MLKGFENTIASHPETALLALTAAACVLTLVCLYLLAQVLRMRRKFAFLMRGGQTGDLGEVFAEHGRSLERLESSQKELRGLLAAVLEKQQTTLQGVGVVRFDAFDDVGGQQSYAVAMLDGAANGVILSSVYSRNDSRTYAKVVRGGRCRQTLSSDEQEALDIAAGTRPPAPETVP